MLITKDKIQSSSSDASICCSGLFKLVISLFSATLAQLWSVVKEDVNLLHCQGKYVPPDRAEVATEESNDDTEEDAGDTDQSNVKIEDVNEETHEQQSNQEPDIDLD